MWSNSQIFVRFRNLYHSFLSPFSDVPCRLQDIGIIHNNKCSILKRYYANKIVVLNRLSSANRVYNELSNKRQAGAYRRVQIQRWHIVLFVSHEWRRSDAVAGGGRAVRQGLALPHGETLLADQSARPGAAAEDDPIRKRRLHRVRRHAVATPPTRDGHWVQQACREASAALKHAVELDRRRLLFNTTFRVAATAATTTTTTTTAASAGVFVRVGFG